MRNANDCCVLEVGDTVNNKSDSITFLALCQSWILGGAPGAASAPGYANLIATIYLGLIINIIWFCYFLVHLLCEYCIEVSID